MVDLLLARVVHLCRELGELLGSPVALCPQPKTHLYQVLSLVNPENGRVQSEIKQVLHCALSLKEIETYLVKYLNLTKLRQKAINDIAVAWEA